LVSRQRHRDANMRGGLGVRKRLSEESLRVSYRLNGVRKGQTIARCFDKYGRWDLGYELGTLVRMTGSNVFVRWDAEPDEVAMYSQGDARYEVDRGRWRILAARIGHPLDPFVDALTGEARNAMMGHRQNAGAPPTEEMEMSNISNAAAERAAAKKALANGDFKDREEYTAKQVAMRCGTDAKTMRKFFRSSHSTVEPVGQGGRYVFDSRDLPKIKREFESWRKRAEANTPVKRAELPSNAQQVAKDLADEEFSEDDLMAAFQAQADQELAADDEPSDDDLADIEMDDLELEDLED
jgi:hypothetical protein